MGFRVSSSGPIPNSAHESDVRDHRRVAAMSEPNQAMGGAVLRSASRFRKTWEGFITRINGGASVQVRVARFGQELSMFRDTFCGIPAR